MIDWNELWGCGLPEGQVLEHQLKQLRAARAAGVQRVAYGSAENRRELVFRTDAEMAAAISDLERRLAEQRGGGGRIVRIATSKGL
jgi:hypothetical protein